MNTFQLRCFLAVSNSLSFARAAEQMNVSQPAITHQIQTLENELNTKLFHRSTRMVELTLDGYSFIPYAQEMVEMEQQAKLRFGGSEGRAFEILSIGIGSQMMFSDLEPIFSEMLVLHPNLHPKLHATTHERLFHMLNNDSAQVIFNFQEIAPSREHIVFVPLCKSSIICLGKRDPSDEQGNTLSIEQLMQRSVIIHDPVFLSSEALNLHMELTGNRGCSNIHFSDSVAGAVTLAKAGYGLAIIPEIYAHSCADLSLYRLKQAPVLTFGLFYNEMNRGDTLASFLKLTKKYFPAATNYESSLTALPASVPPLSSQHDRTDENS